MKKAHTKVNQDKKTKRETMVKKNDKILIIYKTSLVKHKMITKLTVQHKLPMNIENISLLLLHIQYIYTTIHDKHIFIPCVTYENE
jgi:hypothetical protein